MRAALLLALVVIAIAHVRGAGEHPNNQDRELDLLLARRIRAEGVLSDGARSPLLPLALAPVAGDDPAFYERARWVALLLGGLAFAGTFLLVRATLGARVAFVSAIALGPEWTFHVSRIRPEPIVACALVAMTAAVVRARTSSRPTALHALAGGAAGLVHLGKGSGPLTVGAVLLVLVVTWRRRAFRPMLVFLAGFLVAAGPLIVDSVRRFGSPFFNANIAHVMWESAGEDQQWRWSTATAASWWAEHGLSGSLARLGQGLLDVHYGPILLVALVATALAFVAARRRAERGRAALAWGGVAAALILSSGTAFAWWTPIANGRRYLFPVLAVAGPALVAFLDAWIARRSPRFGASEDRFVGRAFRAASHPIALGVAVLAVVAVEVREASHPPIGGPRVPFDAPTLAMAARLRELPPDTRVLAGPAATVPAPWLVYPNAIYDHLPSGLDADAAGQWIRDHADYVLLSDNLLGRRPVPFHSWARLEAGSGAPGSRLVEGAPPAWAERIDVPAAGGEYLLYRVLR